MSSSDDGIPTVADEMAIISGNLNSTFLTLFLMGAYTAVYVGTINIYVSSRRSITQSHKWIVLGTTTALYGLLVLQTVIQWYFANITFCTQGSSRLDILIDSINDAAVPPAFNMIFILSSNMSFILADALLIWRCFYASGESLLRFRVAIPMCFFIIELVLCVVDTVFVSLLSLRPTFRTLEHARMSNIVGGVMYISIALTSLTGTFMICYHIYSSTSNSKARKRYKRIVDILIQSSIMYTTAIVLETISQFVSTEETPKSAVQSLILNEISTSLSSIITGLAPTIMVAQLTIASTNREKTDLPSETVSYDLPDQLPSQYPGSEGGVEL